MAFAAMEDFKQSPRKPFLGRKMVAGGAMILAVIIAVAVGLGAGLAHRPHSSSASSQSSTPTPTSIPPGNASVPASIWQPVKGTSWQYELLDKINTTLMNGFDVWDIDLFDNEAGIITGLQSNGAKVICYFSAGSYENWRADSGEFSDSDLGNDLSGWPGERWLNISSPAVHKIMLARLDLAKQKGCDGVDPDNVDGYDNDNGLNLSQTDSIIYLELLADAAHQRNLSIGLKNAGEILPNVINIMEWSVNEQCVQYDECEVFAPFIQQGKPVFHVEYPKGDSVDNDNAASQQEVQRICGDLQAVGFSTIMKNTLLDSWTERCPS